jgi:hypothetical protein
MVSPAPPNSAGMAPQHYSGGVKKTRIHLLGGVDGHALHTCSGRCNRNSTSGVLRKVSL